jgi:hypothetical protein
LHLLHHVQHRPLAAQEVDVVAAGDDGACQGRQRVGYDAQVGPVVKEGCYLGSEIQRQDGEDEDGEAAVQNFGAPRRAVRNPQTDALQQEEVEPKYLKFVPRNVFFSFGISLSVCDFCRRRCCLTNFPLQQLNKLKFFFSDSSRR